MAEPPAINAMLFTADAVYIGIQGIIPAEAKDASPPPGTAIGTPTELWYRMDRKSGAVGSTTSVPADAVGIPVSTMKLTNLGRGWSSATTTFMATSDGDIYSIDNPYCGPIATNGRLLKMDCTPAGPVAAPGEMITAIEDFGPYLFLGTIGLQQTGPAAAPGRGVLVLSRKDGSVVRTLGVADGLTGSAIELIRRDPTTGGVWIETPRALTELSPTLTVIDTWYLSLALDALGAPALAVTSEPRYDDPYAVLALKLHVTDFADWKDAVARIPAAMQGDLMKHAFPQGHPPMTPVPTVFQPLSAFVIADLKRDPDPRQSLFALRSLCYFEGEAVRAEADALISTTSGTLGANVWNTVRTCATPAVATAHAPPPPNYTMNGGQHMVMAAYASSASRIRITGSDLTIDTFAPAIAWWDGKHVVHLQDETGNDAATAGPSLTRYFASPTLPVDPAHATAVFERHVPALSPGASDIQSADVMFPANLKPGLYFIAVCTNADHAQSQAFEEDRCRIPKLALPWPSSP
jgi:hypothetical protein